MICPVGPGPAADRSLGGAAENITVVRQADGEICRLGQLGVPARNVVFKLVLR